MTTTNLPAHFFTTLLRFPLFGSSNNLLGLHGVTQISQGSVSDGWGAFLFGGRPLRAMENQHADSFLVMCYTDLKSKEVLQPLSKPLKATPRQVSSWQVGSSSCTAADTWMRSGYKGLSSFCWGAKTILGTCTKKPAPRLKQAAENGSAQRQSQVLRVNVWKVSDICWHALVPEAMLLPAPSLTSPTYQLTATNGPLSASRKSCRASDCSIRRNLSSSIMLF